MSAQQGSATAQGQGLWAPLNLWTHPPSPPLPASDCRQPGQAQQHCGDPAAAGHSHAPAAGHVRAVPSRAAPAPCFHSDTLTLCTHTTPNPGAATLRAPPPSTPSSHSTPPSRAALRPPPLACKAPLCSSSRAAKKRRRRQRAPLREKKHSLLSANPLLPTRPPLCQRAGCAAAAATAELLHPRGPVIPHDLPHAAADGQHDQVVQQRGQLLGNGQEDKARHVPHAIHASGGGDEALQEGGKGRRCECE